MPDLLIRIRKNKDGSASLACVRADGSTTWERQDGQLGADVLARWLALEPGETLVLPFDRG
ncbi:MAG TPA: hypothetical protein VES88_14535 [Gemmatimonadaceae bacterium]|nr:hypothetical protein [Gemmatimonadaceae bacterium]